MRYNKNDFIEEIIFDRDTSQPKDKLKFRRRLRRPEAEKSTNKSLDFKFNKDSLFDYGKDKLNDKNSDKNNNNKNSKNNNNNSKENGGSEVNDDDKNISKLSNGKDKDKDDKSNNEKDLNINKETQNAFIQVNFLNEIMENERKKILLKFKERENELKLKINELIHTTQIVRIDSNKEVLELKTKLNEKKEEIIDLKNINNNLKKQIAKLTDKISNLNNQIIDLRRKNTIYSMNRSNISSENKENDDESTKSKDQPLFDFYANNIGDKKDLKKQNNRYNSENIQEKNIKNNKKKDRLKEELERIKEFKRKDQTRVKLNRSIDIQNKNKFNNLLKQMNRTSREYEKKNRNDIKDKYKSEPNLSIYYLSKNNSNNKKRETLQKMQKDYSVRIYNNIFAELSNEQEKRATSARIINLKKNSKDIHNSSMSKNNLNKIFNETERKALSTLFDSQEELNTFNKKISIIENKNEALVRKLLLQNKLLTKENANKKEEVNILQEKLKEYETKLKTANNQLNYEKYILNKTRKSMTGTKISNENNKK